MNDPDYTPMLRQAQFDRELRLMPREQLQAKRVAALYQPRPGQPKQPHCTCGQPANTFNIDRQRWLCQHCASPK
ncbi:hypothetical protein [Herpetosiphon geysericola]|uniref:Uncharacterized protein n=1 Tax=Herpetosiphon geysericola TaxID=70996 RepID=A0A0P6YDV3_9CHLR|nr:hypothetical protein [Herpetosiphon geysericola]KPL80204.1 hypothetical protein SE18_24415 [Herpetosiphon geysericola]